MPNYKYKYIPTTVLFQFKKYIVQSITIGSYNYITKTQCGWSEDIPVNTNTNKTALLLTGQFIIR